MIKILLLLPFIMLFSGEPKAAGGYVIILGSVLLIKAKIEEWKEEKEKNALLAEYEKENKKQSAKKSTDQTKVLSAEDKLKKAHADGVLDEEEYNRKLTMIKLKKGLDSGVLTQEEYDKKVSELDEK